MVSWTPAKALLLTPAGGDSFLQICLWRQGFAVTDPGPGLTLPDVQMFDPGTEDRKGLMHRWISALEGECDEVCQVGLCNLEPGKPLKVPPKSAQLMLRGGSSMPGQPHGWWVSWTCDC